MPMSQKAKEASLINLKGQVDGMITAVKTGVLDYPQALAVIVGSCEELKKRDLEGGE